jgi:hypothetical protein
VYNIDTDGAEHLRGGEHGVGDNRLEMAEMGGEPPAAAPLSSASPHPGRANSLGAQHSISLN